MKRRDGGLRALVQTWMPEAFWQSIETGATGTGTPDSHYLFKGGASGWVEHKTTKANKVATLTPEQVGWADRYVRKGGRSFFMVRQYRLRGPRSEPLDVLWMIDGAGGKLLIDGGLSAVEVDGEHLLLRCVGGPAKWRWDIVRNILIGKYPRG